MRSIVSRAHGRIQRDAGAGRVVCAHGYCRHDSNDQGRASPPAFSETIKSGAPSQRAGTRFSQARGGCRPVADHQRQSSAHLSLAQARSWGIFRRRQDGLCPLPGNHAGRPAAAPGPLRTPRCRDQGGRRGSVGTWCGILLLLASEQDPLFLQVKEARPSVLEAYAGKSMYANHGQRVVNGYRLMQSASDLFLGWAVGPKGRHCYIRQLKDMKIGMLVEAFTRSVMMQYAELCGWTLAHAHARSGEAAKISGYLGKSDSFDEAIADFAKAYADQNERDHKILVKAVREGRLEAQRPN